MAEPTHVVTRKKMSTRTKTALWLLIAPGSLFVLTIFLFAISNYLFSTIFTDGSLSNSTTNTVSIIIPLVNIILFLMGAVSFLSFLPGLIIGIVLLATANKPPVPPAV